VTKRASQPRPLAVPVAISRRSASNTPLRSKSTRSPPRRYCARSSVQRYARPSRQSKSEFDFASTNVPGTKYPNDSPVLLLLALHDSKGTRPFGVGQELRRGCRQDNEVYIRGWARRASGEGSHDSDTHNVPPVAHPASESIEKMFRPILHYRRHVLDTQYPRGPSRRHWDPRTYACPTARRTLGRSATGDSPLSNGRSDQ